ncbi:hypothetical protein [Spiroplasma endosymbiont of Agriotes lineatus]|uniref:hypothetical protein n=1 Tax=Spiroplasma endosymbiont of Agriotes lineatus TaxID=3077930 RepID=UPI0030D05789
MKKLLSLLSTITMAGSGISGIVANSPYEKQEFENNKKISKFKRNINNLNLINSYFINKDNFNVRQINEITRSVNHIAIFSNTVGTQPQLIVFILQQMMAFILWEQIEEFKK